MSKRVLAFDLGASSGRAILAEYFDGTFKMQEIHRFPNEPVLVNGTLYWDVLRLFFHIKQGIQKASLSGEIDSIGIDTWGVDFGLLDKKGNLIENPVHYRDERTVGLVEEAFETINQNRLYGITGIEIMELNTLFQLLALKKYSPDTLERADTLLFTPDLLNYFLTGVKAAEYSIASTSQILDASCRIWSEEILEAFGLPKSLLKPVIPAGTLLGKLSDGICKELGINKSDVIAVASHDTASAVLAAPATEEDFIFLSSGTWSLFGTELKEPIINEKSIGYNVTNEGGFGGKILFHKNVIGTWLLQECRRQWKHEGKDYSFDELEDLALQTHPFQYFIDPSDSVFVASGNMPKRIQEYCLKTGQSAPQTIGEVVRCIYESLALKYREAFDIVRDCTGKEYHTIHLVGGGANSSFLCQMTASACGIQVDAGPVEATALGNIVVQLMALGEIRDIREARALISRIGGIKKYSPQDTEAWAQSYRRFISFADKGNSIL